MGQLCAPNNKPLREALDAPDGFIVSRHREYIERMVRSTHAHTAVFRELIDESTCVLYALSLFQNRTYRAIASNFGGKIFAGRAFMEWLINGHLVEIDEPIPGCLALYFDERASQHAGFVSHPRRVISQWGMFPVCEHDVCEVPARYGNKLRYFSMPGPGEPLRMSLDYAKTSGISNADIAKVVNA